MPKSLANIDDESSEDEAPPSKVSNSSPYAFRHPFHVSSQCTKTSGKGKEPEPSTPVVPGHLRSSTKAETTAPNPKKGLVREVPISFLWF
jgi:hypothetical protein